MRQLNKHAPPIAISGDRDGLALWEAPAGARTKTVKQDPRIVKAHGRDALPSLRHIPL